MRSGLPTAVATRATGGAGRISLLLPAFDALGFTTVLTLDGSLLTGDTIVPGLAPEASAGWVGVEPDEALDEEPLLVLPVVPPISEGSSGRTVGRAPVGGLGDAGGEDTGRGFGINAIGPAVGPIIT